MGTDINKRRLGMFGIIDTNLPMNETTQCIEYHHESGDPHGKNITVILSIFDRTDFYHEALDSLTKQTIESSRFEVIIVTNKTLDIKGEFRFKLKILKTTALELGMKLLIAITHAEGDVICFLEDDDVFGPEKLALVSQVFLDLEVGYYHNSFKYINNATSIFDGIACIRNDIQIFETRNTSLKNLRTLIQAQVDFNLSSISIRKELIAKVSDYLPLFTAKYLDTFLFMTAIDNALKIAYGGVATTLVRIHSQNSSGKTVILHRGTNANDPEREIRACSRALKCLSKPSLIEFANEWLVLRTLDDKIKANSISRISCLSQWIRLFLLTNGAYLRSDVFVKLLLYVLHPRLLGFALSYFHEHQIRR